MKRAFLLAAGILLAWLPAGAAWGHALLDSSEPSEGALLDAAPSEVRLTFTEAPDTKLSVVDLLDQSGVEVQTPEARPDPSDPRTLVIPVGGLQDGVYTVSWRVLSTVDGHVTAGTFGFGVGVDSAIPPPDQGVDSTTGAQRPSVLAVAGRWGFYWGAAALLGLAAVGLIVFGSGWRPEGRWVWGACLLAAVGLVGMLLAERSAVGVGLGDLLGSDRGRVLGLRAGGLILVGI
ncbi:MAG TPA: copper resistance CopC family protein, partial [Actinomycetota bacterium]|nr:copper resistance CopC family protein [Actinomycetota bacterium]